MRLIETLIILGMAVVTFGVRYILFAFQDRLQLPQLIRSSLKYIPPAVLTAITIPMVLMPENQLDLSWSNPYLFASVVATIAGIASKNLLITIVLGLAGFFIFRWIVV